MKFLKIQVFKNRYIPIAYLTILFHSNVTQTIIGERIILLTLQAYCSKERRY